MSNKILYYKFFVFLIIFIIALLPKLKSKYHFQVTLLTNGYLNLFLIFLFMFILSFEDTRLSILLLVLLFTFLYVDETSVNEGFISFYK